MAGFEVRTPFVLDPDSVPNGDPELSPGLREPGDRCPGLSQPRTRALKGHRNHPLAPCFGSRIESTAPLQGAWDFPTLHLGHRSSNSLSRIHAVGREVAAQQILSQAEE